MGALIIVSENMTNFKVIIIHGVKEGIFVPTNIKGGRAHHRERKHDQVKGYAVRENLRLHGEAYLRDYQRLTTECRCSAN